MGEALLSIPRVQGNYTRPGGSAVVPDVGAVAGRWDAPDPHRARALGGVTPASAVQVAHGGQQKRAGGTRRTGRGAAPTRHTALRTACGGGASRRASPGPRSSCVWRLGWRTVERSWEQCSTGRSAAGATSVGPGSPRSLAGRRARLEILAGGSAGLGASW